MPPSSASPVAGEQTITNQERNLYLLRPFTMGPSHVNAHLSDVRHFLSLEPVKISLDGRTRILEVLGSEVNRVFQL